MNEEHVIFHRKRSMLVLIEHDDIGDEMFMKPVGRLLVEYGNALIDGEAGSDGREGFVTEDGFRLTANVCNPPAVSRLLKGRYKVPRGPYMSYDCFGRATHHDAPDSPDIHEEYEKSRRPRVEQS